jgi:ketosteroid isomerase-like protein
MTALAETFDEIYAAIVATMTAYVRAVDNSDPDAIVANFCDDGWIRLPNREAVHGRDAIRTLLTRPPSTEQMRHVVTSERVFDITEGSASALSDLAVVVRAEGGPWTVANVGRYTDTFHRTDAGWLIHGRSLDYL